VDIMHLVDELETIVSKSPRLPFTANVILNEDDLFDIIDQIRIAVPQEIKEAKRTEAERERILGRAKEESERLLGMAKDKIMTAVDDHEVVEAAKAERNAILAQAKTEAEQFKNEAHIYVTESLSHLEQYLMKLLTTVQNGINEVEKEQFHQPDEDAPAPRPISRTSP